MVIYYTSIKNKHTDIILSQQNIYKGYQKWLKSNRNFLKKERSSELKGPVKEISESANKNTFLESESSLQRAETLDFAFKNRMVSGLSSYHRRPRLVHRCKECRIIESIAWIHHNYKKLNRERGFSIGKVIMPSLPSPGTSSTS